MSSVRRRFSSSWLSASLSAAAHHSSFTFFVLFHLHEIFGCILLPTEFGLNTLFQFTNLLELLACRYFQAQAPPMDETDLRCDLCLIGSLFSDACSSPLCEESLTPCLPNNATFESVSCTFIINILAVAEALSDTCSNLIIVFLSLIRDCLLGRGGERGRSTRRGR